MLETQHVAAAVSVTAANAIAWAAGAVPCGQRSCGEQEYCSEGSFCLPCQPICNPDSHNYDETTCKTSCSAYLLSRQFVSREELDAAVATVYVYVVAALVISVLVLLLVLSAFLTVWLKYQRVRGYSTGSMKKKKVEAMKAVCVNEVDGKKNLKLELPVPIPENKDTPPSALTTMTPLSTRHPSEDATLEYAYDNPALTPSPLFGKNQPQPTSTPKNTPRVPRTETSF